MAKSLPAETGAAGPEAAPPPAAPEVGDAARNTGASEPIEGAMAKDEPAETQAPDPRLGKIVEIIRAALRNSPVSRSVEAWNHLESVLPGVAAEIVKEL